MTTEIKFWKIEKDDHLQVMKDSKLNLEERLEGWLEKDITLLSSDLLVIGRQVPTDFGGIIDLLCLDSKGDTAIVELKRDKTPREREKLDAFVFHGQWGQAAPLVKQV